ncbi:MAG: hypothetical protein AB7U46_08510 [Paenirhodobacter sp.]|uniref:hypothetical protein n=1 Tax=Paenirhodobacter sp. TaxID=1965326 RepID=UPI003D0AEC18
MHLKTPADELADIRAEIARLRKREAELRAAYLGNPELPKIGRWHKVELKTLRQRVFEPRLLPEEIRLDPAYMREKVTRVLRTSRVPVQAVDGAELPLPRPTPRARLFAGLSLH